jgi:hypothetical protein
MIAHNKIELKNQFLTDEAQSLFKAGFISKEQLNQIQSQLKIPKTQKSLLIRIGLGILGVFLYSSICGFLSIVGIEFIDRNYEYFLFIYALIGFVGAEFFIKQRNYGYGFDDAFIIGGQFIFAVAVGVLSKGNGLLIAIFASIITLFAYLRYVNSYSALFFCVSITATLVFSLFELGSIGKTILPFAAMLFALILFLLSRKYSQSVPFLFYHKGILLTKNFSLLLFYLSGNYMVVRELSELLLDVKIAPNQDISFALFFYVFTFIVPLLYLCKGIQLKNRAMFWIGVVCFGFSIYTIRYYYPILPMSIVLTLGGIMLFVITYFSIKKLKDQTSGLTFLPDRFINTSDFIHTEAILLTSQFGLKPETTTTSPMEFGGGGFSGGGSSGDF